MTNDAIVMRSMDGEKRKVSCRKRDVNLDFNMKRKSALKLKISKYVKAIDLE